jgi:hypothetical protein
LTELVVFITPHIVDGQVLVTGDEKAERGFKTFRDYQPKSQQRPPGGWTVR